jgi:hypothetical protein
MRTAPLAALLLSAALILGAAQVSASTLILTKDMVSRFVASFPEVKMIALREGLSASAKAKEKGKDNPVAVIVAAISRKELRDEVQGVVARHGFRSVKDWAKTAKSIGEAYIHITAGGAAAADASKEMDDHRSSVEKEIAKLGFLSDKQKKKLMDKYDEASDGLDDAPPPQNVAIVTEMKPQIEAVVKLGLN